MCLINMLNEDVTCVLVSRLKERYRTYVIDEAIAYLYPQTLR